MLQQTTPNLNGLTHWRFIFNPIHRLMVIFKDQDFDNFHLVMPASPRDPQHTLVHPRSQCIQTDRQWTMRFFLPLSLIIEHTTSACNTLFRTWFYDPSQSAKEAGKCSFPMYLGKWDSEHMPNFYHKEHC